MIKSFYNKIEKRKRERKRSMRKLGKRSKRNWYIISYNINYRAKRVVSMILGSRRYRTTLATDNSCRFLLSSISRSRRPWHTTPYSPFGESQWRNCRRVACREKCHSKFWVPRKRSVKIERLISTTRDCLFWWTYDAFYEKTMCIHWNLLHIIDIHRYCSKLEGYFCRLRHPWCYGEPTLPNKPQ